MTEPVIVSEGVQPIKLDPGPTTMSVIENSSVVTVELSGDVKDRIDKYAHQNKMSFSMALNKMLAPSTQPAPMTSTTKS